MNQALILWPLVAQVILVVLLFIRLGQVKDRARAANLIDPERTALDNDAWPDEVRKVANSIRNQFQVPVLFFVVVLALHALDAVDIYALVFAWIFVATRVVHASIHISSNYVPSRTRAFKLSLVVLAILLALLIRALAAGSPSTTERLGLPPLETVPGVELERYLGTWYEIASYPQRFQEGCTATTATYTQRGDGEIGVLNRCRKGGPDGTEAVSEGRARVVDTQTNAKLEVSFFGPFWGDYWIIDLGPDYEYAVVGHPSRDYLWILSRTPTLDDETYDGILRRLEDMGYPLEPLRKTLQPTGSTP